MSLVEEITQGPDGSEFDAESFLAYFRHSSPHWWPGDCHESPWLFRGQRDSNWTLLPSAARPLRPVSKDNRFETLIDKLRGDGAIEALIRSYPDNLLLALGSGDLDDYRQRAVDQLVRQWAHEILLRGFVQLARELDLGHFDEPPPRDLVSWLESNLRMRDGLSIYHYLSWRPHFDFFTNESVALAQHHEIPTFLLDWTKDPLASVYFATVGEPGPVGISVWALDRRLACTPYDRTHAERLTNDHDFLPIGVYQPSGRQNQYLTSQSGVFSYTRFPFSRWLQNGQYPSLEAMVEDYKIPQNLKLIRDEIYSTFDPRMPNRVERDQCHLRKVILARKHVPRLRRLLLRERRSLAHLMPTLDNVAKVVMDHVPDSFALLDD